MRAARLAIAWALCLASCADGAPRTASVRLGLTADQCADYCAVTVIASILRADDGLPIGPDGQAPCGEDIVFSSLPAGHRVFVRMSLLDLVGGTLLSGTSEVVTVVADDIVDAPVPLTSPAPPEILGVGPDPVSVSSGPVTLTITGSGFAPSEGAWGVTLGDDVALAVDAWSDATVAATLTPGQLGDAVRVRRCGVRSASAPVRILAREAPGALAVAQPPGCDGRGWVAVAVDGDEVLAAAVCGDPGKGYVQRVEPESDACSWDAGASWSLGDNPADVAVRGDLAWIALAGGGIARLTPASGAVMAASLPPDLSARAVAAPSSGPVYALATGDAGDALLAAEDGLAFAPAPGLAPGREYEGLAASASAVFATAREGALGKLVRLLVASTIPAEWTLTGCDAPGAIAVTDDGGLVAIGCDDPDAGAVALFTPADPPVLVRVPLGEGAQVAALAFDPAGDVVFAWDAGRDEVVVVARDAGAGEAGVLERWNVAAPAVGPVLAPLPADGAFLASDAAGDGLAVWAPYHEHGPCAGSAQ